MSLIADPFNPDLVEGQVLGPYMLKRRAAADTIAATFYELEHLPTGARHIHVSRDDAENTFGVAFKTVPRDSTGVAHILEHTVLCGSAKFPVRDPFFSMLKRSLNTFMNAFTGSDWTMYPFSTQNRKDFYNLMAVYLDAAFFPRIAELSFKQEGCRLDVAPGNDPDLAFKGVVFNEMKGAMSSPDQVMVRSMLNALYPDTTYRFNSGGEPADIPDLTHAQLKAFHQRHYHPSNAYVFTYGNLPLADHLAFIHEQVLSQFTRIDPGTEVHSQSRWNAPRQATYYYPLGPDEDPAKKAQVSLAWLAADIGDTFEILVLAVLEHILIGNPGSPLHQALIESRLGTALSDGTGFDAENRDTLFAAGLKDVAIADADRIEALILQVLTSLADKGIDKELIELAIHQIEFHRKEVTNTPYPYGLRLLMTLAGTWFHGGDPLRVLNLDADLERLRQSLAQPGFLEQRLRRYFLDNPHRVRMHLEPDQDLARRQQEAENARLRAIAATLSQAQREQIIADNQALEKLQQAEENVNCLPTLTLADIPPSVRRIAASSISDTIPAACYVQPTAGIFYLSAVARIQGLPEELVPLVPFFCHALPKAGTAVRDYVSMARRIDAYTGGLGLSANARTHFDGDGRCLPFVSLSVKCLNRNIEPAFDIAAELVSRPGFGDLQRLKALVLEYRSGLESAVVHNGHRLAISLASRGFSPTSALAETWHGIHQLRFIKQITADLDDSALEALAAKLVDLGTRLWTKDRIQLGLIGEDSPLTQAQSLALALTGALDPGHQASGTDLAAMACADPSREGWTTSTAVSFVAKSFATVRLTDPDAPVLAVIAKMMRSLYLHREIREKGGAYGGFALYDPETGLFSFGSYRDPHILATLKAYEGAADFILSDQIRDQDVTEAILQVCAEIDKPDPPGPAARKAFFRRIIGLEDETRQTFKANLLQIKGPAQVKEVARRHFAQAPTDCGVAVISSAERLTAANARLGEKALVVKAI